MARRRADDEQRPPGRFSRSGHTSHHQPPHHQPPSQYQAPPQYPREPYPAHPHPTEPYPPQAQPGPAPQPRPYRGPQAHAPQRYNPPPDAVPGPQPAPPDERYYDQAYQPLSEQPTTRLPPGPPPGTGFDPPRYRDTRDRRPDAPPAAPPPGPGAPNLPGAGDAAKVTVTRAVVSRSNQLARTVTNKVISASKADGAAESGLTALIWNQVLSYGTDAMITVALAGTVFFGASTNAQRGNVLLYLLVTMAPFAVVAPIIGPALDRLQHGRRWAMAATAIGRAVLALVMASDPTNLLVLYPCALGSLVLSKAYSVIRAAAAPRLVPPGLTLVEANARLSIFGLGSALVGGAFVGAVIKLSGSYTAGLVVTAIAFATCAFFAVKLPKQVDSASPVGAQPQQPPARPAEVPEVLPLGRIGRLGDWARRGFAAQVITSLQGESMLRFLSGFLTIFLAFNIEATRHGFSAAAALGGVAIGAGVGNFVGTGIGARLKYRHPELLIMIGCAVGAVACLLTAILFDITIAIVAMFISAVVNSLSKIALDAVIQRDVAESLRSSAFARSETFLQLAWVLGAAVGVLMPAKDGALGFWVAAVVTGVATVVIVLRNRAMRRATSTSRAGAPRVI